MRKSYWPAWLLGSVAMMLLAVEPCHAGFGMLFGIGPSYNDFRISNDFVRGSRVERGAGYQIRVKLRFSPEGTGEKKGSGDMGVDVGPMFRQSFTNDITPFVNERNISTGWGGEIDVFYKYLYLGLTYGRQRSSIDIKNSPLQALDLYYDPLEVRVGARIPFNQALELWAGPQYLTGTAKTSDAQNKSLVNDVGVRELSIQAELTVHIFTI